MRGFCGIVSQAAGGFCFHRDPRERRITKYRYTNVPVDRPGRYFYIKDNETGEYWSPTWQPVQKDMESYECSHGQGYTKITSKYKNIAHETVFFVPVGHDCEVWDLKLKNEGAKARSFSVYSYCEFTFWSEPESRNIQWSLHLTRCGFDKGLVLYNFIEPHPAFDMNANRNYVGDRPGYAFMGLSVPVLDHECVRDKFIGMYRSETNPAGLETDRLTDSRLEGGIACAALRTEIRLEPGEEKAVTVTMGYADTADEAAGMRDYFSKPGVFGRELKLVRDNWSAYLDSFKVQSPDKDFNSMINVWNQYQCKTTFDWSRYISFYENGEGRGMGTRDSCQDTLAVCAQLPERVKSRIFQILSTTQFETGDCYHQFFPLGGKGDLKGFSDDHLWLVQMVHAYITETGDIGILGEICGYADSVKTDTIYAHLTAALSYTERMKGPNGLPLILTADWNDTLHLWMESDKAESVLTAELYVYALKQTAELAAVSGKPMEAEALEYRAAAMTELINEKCWDGGWYVRGFGSEVIGTNKSEKGKIFLNSQVWAVISGVADEERAVKCMDSVRKYLDSDEGVKKLWPSFDRYDQTFGLISRYVKGRKENGIFAHANSWAIIAEAILERPEVSFEYYKKILPVARNGKAEIFKTEPYVFCQTIASDEALNKGEGANSWLTGTASWMYVAVTQHILGIKPVFEGLRVKPCVPEGWNEFKVTRTYRGCEYNFEFRRTGVREISVDGKTLKGDIIPPVSAVSAAVEVTF
jgi:cellobiose phosphorylase